MKRIDDYIKDRVESFDFDFDESYWNQAEALIVAEQEKKRKKRFIAYFMSLVVVLTLAVTAVFQVNKSSITSDNGEMVNVDEQSERTENGQNNTDFVRSANERPNPSSTRKSSTAQAARKNRKEKSKNRGVKATQILPSSTIESSVVQSTPSKSVQEVKAATDSLLLMEKRLAELRSFKSMDEIYEPSEYMDVLKRRKRVLALMQIGVTESSSWKPGYFANFQALIELNRQHSISTGIGFKMLNNEFLQYSYDDIDYSFGESITRTTVTTDRLYYIELPVQYRCQFFKRNTLQLGISANYLAAQRDRFSSVSEGGEVNEISKFGTSNDFANFDVQGSLGYENSILGRYRIGVSYHYGLLSNLESNNKQELVNDHFNSEFRAYILMSLFK